VAVGKSEDICCFGKHWPCKQGLDRKINHHGMMGQVDTELVEGKDT
jgi:hypothetical protein